MEDRLDLQDALEAIAESEKLGEQAVPWESVQSITGGDRVSSTA